MGMELAHHLGHTTHVQLEKTAARGSWTREEGHGRISREKEEGVEEEWS